MITDECIQYEKEDIVKIVQESISDSCEIQADKILLSIFSYLSNNDGISFSRTCSIAFKFFKEFIGYRNLLMYKSEDIQYIDYPGSEITKTIKLKKCFLTQVRRGWNQPIFSHFASKSTHGSVKWNRGAHGTSLCLNFYTKKNPRLAIIPLNRVPLSLPFELCFAGDDAGDHLWFSYSGNTSPYDRRLPEFKLLRKYPGQIYKEPNLDIQFTFFPCEHAHPKQTKYVLLLL